MARTTIQDLSHDETLPTLKLEQVKGGLIGLLLPAVQKVEEARRGDVVPTDQFSLNFTKITFN